MFSQLVRFVSKAENFSALTCMNLNVQQQTLHCKEKSIKINQQIE